MTEETKGSHQEEKKKVIFYALSMALGTMSSRVLGLIRDMAFAALFSRTVTDAWTAAFRLPNLFRRLLGEGSLSISFIPVFVEARLEDEKNGTHHRAQNLVNGFYTILLAVLILLTSFGIIKAEMVLQWLLDPEYVQNVQKFALTVRMSQIMFGFIFLMSHYAFFMGILNAMGQYSLPAMAPVFFNIAMIISTVLPSRWFPIEGDALAWGVLLGGLWQMAVLIPSLRAKNYFPKISFQFSNPDVMRVFKSMAPGLLGTGLLQITTVVNLRFASHLGEGAISYIYWADRLLELPLSLVAVSLGTALLPTLAKMWAEKNPEKMLETSNHYLRLNLFVVLPAAVGLFVLAEPIVEVLFKRGHFTEQDLKATAQVVSIYAFILIASSLVRVLVPVYYAMKNTWWPATISGVCLLVHILLAPWLMKNWGLQGLVSSTFITASLNFLFLALPLGYWAGSYRWSVLLKSLVLNAFSALMMGFVLVVMQKLVYERWHHSSEILRMTGLAITILIGSISFIVFSYILKSEEFFGVSQTMIDKIKRRWLKWL